MSKLSFAAVFILLLGLSAESQVQFRVYHGLNGESQVYDVSGKEVSKPVLRMKQGDRFSVKVVNPNPLLYKYTLKLETVQIESESKEITDILTTFGTIIAGRLSVRGFAPKTTETSAYNAAINSLLGDINQAKKYLLESDNPESPEDALKYNRTGGYRKAIDNIKSMLTDKFKFNSNTILADLNELSDSAALDKVEKEYFRLLNNALAAKVDDIKKQIDLNSAPAIWQKEFKVTDSAQKISLVISRNDTKMDNLVRDGSLKDFELEIGSVIPFYKRSVIELVPVANFIFSKGVREFYLDNDLVQTRMRTTTLTNAGMMLNVNFARFGESKEMSVGMGPGYKFNDKGDAFENLYLSALFSYKNYLRFGFGFGFAQVPAEQLKNGVKVGQALPSNISNLNDLIQYEEKPSMFLTISFTGLNLTKKK